jgi:hypothetical protein
MTNFITEDEVYEIALNRNVSRGLIKPSHVSAAERIWVDTYFSSEFMEEIRADLDSYREYIDMYIKPIIAWGVIASYFEYITTQITDKGVVQLFNLEGGAGIIGRDSRYDIKLEIRNLVYRLIRIAQSEAKRLKEDEDPLYENYAETETIPSLVFYSGKSSLNLRPY